MLYRYGKRLLHLFLSQFFREIRVIGAMPCEEGPLLVVANHPNHALDPFLVTKVFKRDLWFIARGDLFSTWLSNAFLRAAHLIPIYSKEEREQNKDLCNQDTFQFTTEALAAGKAIVIFPEGMSRNVRRLHEVKTGAARMVLQAEAASSEDLNIKIQPIGVTYLSIQQFQTSVTITVGEPFSFDPHEEVKSLTARVEAALKDVIVEIDEPENDELLHRISRLYASRGTALNEYERLNIVAQHINALAPDFPDKKKEIESKLDRAMLGWGDWDLAGEDGVNARLVPVLLAPIVGLGFLIHWLPYKITGPLAHRLNLHPGSLAATKFILGTFIFFIWHLVILSLTWYFTNSLACGFIAAGIALVLGIITNRMIHSVRVSILSLITPISIQTLRDERDALIEELDTWRLD